MKTVKLIMLIILLVFGMAKIHDQGRKHVKRPIRHSRDGLSKGTKPNFYHVWHFWPDIRNQTVKN